MSQIFGNGSFNCKANTWLSSFVYTSTKTKESVTTPNFFQLCLIRKSGFTQGNDIKIVFFKKAGNYCSFALRIEIRVVVLKCAYIPGAYTEFYF